MPVVFAFDIENAEFHKFVLCVAGNVSPHTQRYASFSKVINVSYTNVKV